MNWSLDITAQVGSLLLGVALSGGPRPVALIGPNGAGKTSLLRIIAGAWPVQSGRIVVGEGASLDVLLDVAAGINRPPEVRGIGYVPQGCALFPHLTVRDNIAFGLSALPRAERRVRAEAMLEAMGGQGLARRSPRHLSGGEQQRVALARALVTEPRLLLLDEPLAALDAGSRRQMRRFLVTHLTGRAAILITHDVRDVMALSADVVVLEAGRVVQQGRPEALAANPATDFVAEFFDVR